MPRVSVIIPVYNVEKYLRECLDSVVNQTLKDIEVICIDDGSTDSSMEILKGYAAKDKRIKIIKQKNKGAGAARNKGLKSAKGEYIHFLDSDDWIEIDAYEKLYNIIKDRDIDFIKFRGFSYNNQLKQITTRNYLDISKVEPQYFENCLNIDIDAVNTSNLPDSCWSGFYRLKFLRDNNIFFDNFVVANDCGFFYRCIINAKSIYLSSERLIYYRENRDNSLIKKRGQNFECQIKLYPIVKKLCSKIQPKIKEVIINHIIICTLRWYKKIIKQYNLNKNELKKLKIQMYEYVQSIQNETLDDKTEELYIKISESLSKYISKIKQREEKERLKKKKERIENIFSIKNVGVHKTICIFGLKLKIRLKKLEEREQHKRSIFFQ